MDDVKDNYSRTLSQGSHADSPDNLDITVPSQRFGPGIRLKDRYLLEKEIGQGGFGTVYLARDEELHSKRVVVKVLLQEFIQDAWFKKKFQQEKEALARIDHPGVVGVLDSGKTPEGNQFLVMQFVEGQTLTSLIKPEGMELAEVARIVQQMGKALTAAHKEGIIHCDLKPENVMVQNANEDDMLIKIIDFGVAKVRDSQVAKSGDVTRVAGTLYYSAPEQIEGKPSAASDVYSMGVIAYMMATGRRPFNPRNGPLHVTAHELLEMQRSGLKFRPKDLRPDLPESAQQAILKALSFDPNARYSRARDFGDALAKALTGEEDEEGVEGRGLDASPDHRPTLEIAHVLIIEIVGHSSMLIEQQSSATNHLQEFARTASQIHRTTRVDRGMVSLPTANGMVLVFFDDPIEAVKCAEEVTQSFKGKPATVRMGLHTGPVRCVRDTNANFNVTGGGINIAQQIMDFGDAGHVLISKSTVDVLKQLDASTEALHDLGEIEVSPGERMRLYSLYDSDVGNAERPRKLKDPSPHSKKRAITIAAVLIAVIVGAAVLWKFVAPPVNGNSGQSTTGQASRTDPRPVTSKPALSLAIESQKFDHTKAQPAPLGSIVPLLDKIDTKGEPSFKVEVGEGFRIKVAATQPGSLYILNDTAGADINVLFPRLQSNNGSASLPANQELYLPPNGWFINETTGNQTYWLVWSSEPISELEELFHSGKFIKGVIVAGDLRQMDKARQYLNKHSATKPEMDLDTAKKQLTIRIGSDVTALSLRKL